MKDASAARGRGSAAWKGILAGGVAAGILDGIFAILFYGAHGASPARIFQSVASGLLGQKAFEGGTPTSSSAGSCSS